VIEESDRFGGRPERKYEPVSFDQAVTDDLADAKARKQLLSWCKAEGYKFLRELDLPALCSLRFSWKDGVMAKKKKQERLTKFFWFCIRAGWITTNLTHKLGRIAMNQVPTDYFAREEFDKLLNATYLSREPFGGVDRRD
jgi:integrase/recombinase XerD